MTITVPPGTIKGLSYQGSQFIQTQSIMATLDVMAQQIGGSEAHVIQEIQYCLMKLFLGLEPMKW